MDVAPRMQEVLQGIWVRRVIALMRIAVGVYFGQEAVRKIGQGWVGGGAAFARSVNGYSGAHSGFYHQFVANVILPHASLFALLVTLGEWFVALSLTLGLLTRAGALVALWLNLNFVVLRGVVNPSGTLDKVFILAELLFLLTAAGQLWGLDGLWRSRLARVPVLAWLAGAESYEP